MEKGDTTFESEQGSDQPMYQIQVEGRLAKSWDGWFDGFAISRGVGPDGTPVITMAGRVADQAALRGALTKIWDLNLSLISVARTGEGQGGRSLSQDEGRAWRCSAVTATRSRGEEPKDED